MLDTLIQFFLTEKYISIENILGFSLYLSLPHPSNLTAQGLTQKAHGLLSIHRDLSFRILPSHTFNLMHFRSGYQCCLR